MAVMGIGFLLALALTAATFRPVVEGDGVGYYSYLHAILVSHSLRFTNEYAAAAGAHVPVYVPLITTTTSTGRLANFFPIGPAVLSGPAYLIALALRPSGEPQYSSPFVQSFTLASLLYGLVGIGLCYRLAASVTANRGSALGAALTATIATPYVYYLVSDPSYSHTFSVFCVSAFVYLWWAHPPRTPAGWFGLGVLGGVMSMTRFQDALVIPIVLVDMKRLRPSSLLFIPGALLGFIPQFVVDQVQFGEWLPRRPPGQDLNLLQPHLLESLISSRDGLFVWAPAAAAVVIGFMFIKDRRFQVALAIAVMLETIVIVSAPDAVGRSFGPRRFLDLLPFATVALAALYVRIGPRLSAPVIVALCGWNIVLETNFEYIMASAPTGSVGEMLASQGDALRYVPRLLGKGAVVRDLILWRESNSAFDPVGGFILLVLEAMCLAAAGVAAVGHLRTRSERT